MKYVKSPFKPIDSIKVRLTLFYTLATAVLLIVSTLFLYFTTLHIMHQANKQFLSDEIDVLKNLVENKPDHLFALKQEVDEVPYTETSSEYHYYIRILSNKTILLETPHFTSMLQKANFFQRPASTKKENAWWKSSNGTAYVLMQVKSNFGKTKDPVVIQVALDISYQQYIISKYSKLLIFTLLIIMLIAILVGYFIASRGMQSLYRLTEATAKITATSLHQRIDPKSWPKELNKVGKAFNQMLDRIETAVLHLTQFAGDLAHELRTPVNNLMGQTEILLAQPRPVAEYRQVLESNLEELQRISHIIENLLFLARAENPKLNLKKEKVSALNEIALISEFHQALAAEKEITITHKGDAMLMVNPIMFRRAFCNVLSNALKYTDKGGTVDFSIKEKSDSVEIVVRDNGIGIGPEHLPKIFHRFYRADFARARSEGGIGLGLPIVKSIIDLHHGTISITSQVKKGTVVTMVFPAS